MRLAQFFVSAGLLLSGCNPLVSSPTTDANYNPGTSGASTAAAVATLALASSGATMIAANGTSTTTLKATATDSGGHPVANASVTLNIPASGGASAGATTNASGIANFTLTSSAVVGIYSFTASAGTVTSSAVNITFGGILDLLTANAGAAYSLRLLKASYTGKCIKVRRASDNTTMDIGFTNGAINTAALTTFVGSFGGYVTTWYDQSGNGFDLTQSSVSYQPAIVSAGSVILLSGLPTIEFGTNGAGNTLLQATALSVFPGLSSFTASSVANLTGATSDGYGRLLDLQYTGDSNDYTNSTSAIPFAQNSGSLTAVYSYREPVGFLSHVSFTSGSPMILTSLNSGNTVTMFGNGTAGAAGTNSGTYALGSSIWINVGNWSTSTGTPITGGGNDALIGHQSEVIVFPSALSTTDRQALEHNQESYYSISGI